MQRWLYLMRHGKSDWHSGAADDLCRPLAARGRRDVPRIADWFVARHRLPERVLISPALRTAQTAALMFDGLSLPSSAGVVAAELYAADVDMMLALIRQQPDDAAAVMLIAHNPGMEELLRLLTRDSVPPGTGKVFPTAACACLQFAGSWQTLDAGGTTLMDVIRPRELGAVQ